MASESSDAQSLALEFVRGDRGKECSRAAALCTLRLVAQSRSLASSHIPRRTWRAKSKQLRAEATHAAHRTFT
jgi:hypothetical protein